jgi:hypothetical protein
LIDRSSDLNWRGQRLMENVNLFFAHVRLHSRDVIHQHPFLLLQRVSSFPTFIICSYLLIKPLCSIHNCVNNTANFRLGILNVRTYSLITWFMDSTLIRHSLRDATCLLLRKSNIFFFSVPVCAITAVQRQGRRVKG